LQSDRRRDLCQALRGNEGYFGFEGLSKEIKELNVIFDAKMIFTCIRLSGKYQILSASFVTVL